MIAYPFVPVSSLTEERGERRKVAEKASQENIKEA
jgi:hypothetical protein